MTLQTLLERCRQNTGKHFLDSGGEFGRHWQKPPIAEDCNPVVIESWQRETSEPNWVPIWTRKGYASGAERLHGTKLVCDPDLYAIMETAHFLSQWGEIDEELQAAHDAFVESEEHAKECWFSCGEQFMESQGFVCVARDNTYNSENSLSQEFVWEVWEKEGEESSDWVWNDEAVCVVYIHTGADVRGGYGQAVIMRSSGDYAAPIDFVCEWHAAEGVRDGERLNDSELRELDESWQRGYSSFPCSAFRDDCARSFEWTRKQDSIVVRLKSGEIVRAVASIPYMGG